MLRKKTRRKTYDLLKKDIIQKQPCVVCGIHDVIAHHKDYSRHNDVIWICESIIQGIMMAKWAFSITNYGERLLPRSMRDGNMPGKYQKLKSQFKKK